MKKQKPAKGTLLCVPDYREIGIPICTFFCRYCTVKMFNPHLTSVDGKFRFAALDLSTSLSHRVPHRQSRFSSHTSIDRQKVPLISGQNRFREPQNVTQSGYFRSSFYGFHSLSSPQPQSTQLSVFCQPGLSISRVCQKRS